MCLNSPRNTTGASYTGAPRPGKPVINGRDESRDISLAFVTEFSPLGSHLAGRAQGRGGISGRAPGSHRGGAGLPLIRLPQAGAAPGQRAPQGQGGAEEGQV